MKVNLVVTAAGTNKGKAIPILGAKFLIGRDPNCNLRPASQSVSKQHCAILIRDGEVYVQDLSSTNGTIVNDIPVQEEQLLKDGDQLKIGPLNFRVEILPSPTPSDGTPLPNKLRSLDSKEGEKIRAATGQSATPTTDLLPSREKIPSSNEGDDAAAMLLGMDDDSPSGEQPSIPGGSTVMEAPAVDAAGRLIPPKKKETDQAESSTAASDLLKKYFRRTGS